MVQSYSQNAVARKQQCHVSSSSSRRFHEPQNSTPQMQNDILTSNHLMYRIERHHSLHLVEQNSEQAKCDATNLNVPCTIQLNLGSKVVILSPPIIQPVGTFRGNKMTESIALHN